MDSIEDAKAATEQDPSMPVINENIAEIDSLVTAGLAAEKTSCSEDVEMEDLSVQNVNITEQLSSKDPNSIVIIPTTDCKKNEPETQEFDVSEGDILMKEETDTTKECKETSTDSSIELICSPGVSDEEAVRDKDGEASTSKVFEKSEAISANESLDGPVPSDEAKNEVNNKENASTIYDSREPAKKSNVHMITNEVIQDASSKEETDASLSKEISKSSTDSSIEIIDSLAVSDEEAVQEEENVSPTEEIGPTTDSKESAEDSNSKLGSPCSEVKEIDDKSNGNKECNLKQAADVSEQTNESAADSSLEIIDSPLTDGDALLVIESAEMETAQSSDKSDKELNDHYSPKDNVNISEQVIDPVTDSSLDVIDSPATCEDELNGELILEREKEAQGKILTSSEGDRINLDIERNESNMDIDLEDASKEPAEPFKDTADFKDNTNSNSTDFAENIVSIKQDTTLKENIEETQAVQLASTDNKGHVETSKKNVGEISKTETAEKMEIDDVAGASPGVLETKLEKDESSRMESEVADETIKPSEELSTYTDGEIFYNKECLNCSCNKNHKQYVVASIGALNYFRVPRKAHKKQFICLGCHDTVHEIYEEYAGALIAKQPLLMRDFKYEDTDFVALDSSDEEDNVKEPESPEFSANDLNLIENELEDAIINVLSNVEIKNQLAWSKTILQHKSEYLERQFALADAEFANLQSIADKMHFTLYNTCQVVHKHLPPLDLYHQPGHDYANVPPPGEIERPPIKLNETYYAVKNKAIASWVSVKVIEFTVTTVAGTAVKSYKIKYLNTPYQMVKTVTAKHIAYFEPPPVRLPIGTRVIAYFDGSTLSRSKDKGIVQSAFYPGIIAEPLKQANRFRYLIFYDDGYTQYVQHNDVRLVCQASEKVWEDVHPVSRDFIQKYIEKYSVDRPMVQCTRGQSMNTESNGTWLYARVIDVDCSLVQMQFEGDKNHTEWIYRGSLRLGPVFKETQNALNTPTSALQQQTRVPRRTEPFIRYTKEMETSNMQVKQQMRAIARKSSSQHQSVAAFQASTSTAAAAAVPKSTVRHLNNSTIYVDDENKPKGNVVYFTAKRNLPPKVYATHDCNPNCLFKIAHRLDSYSPLAKPLLSGWERLLLRQKLKRYVVYRGPCGKSLRNLAEVHAYLRATDNILNVDNFDFTPELHCLAEYSIDPTIVKEADISKGQEKMAIPLVNYYDNTLPPPCIYAKQRIPTEGVNLNLDEEFLVGCDCEDDCSDKSKCSCWKLTIEGVKYCNPNKPVDEIGYQYKRLHEHVPTGIYECNSRCKCKKNCLNRVVQHSLEMKLQVFKTSNRGWGLRCVNDIPKGAFICIYAGHLLTETRANEGGLDAGDEYFADLDYIEVAEQLKEGFESDVEQSDLEEEEDDYCAPEADDDDDFVPKNQYIPRSKNKIRSSRTNSNEVDSQERAVINFNPNADLDETVRENSVRRLFGKDEAPYIMDAKTTGNLGRYFNHSCSPNLFVQNVFVDTHDLRFPWVAFFSANHIRSGTELTWNYNYEVGVVPGKVLYCQCGSTNCRIRLL
ncbi:histone-lysine N-methyltransferase eggless [Scaptodrosophila lebanonensis]|uniref:Histone-lysine N-methyltransferase eggless n=1 Tax=Drosophila lebanonensis TaxID=7225 RepID=A0A6J2UJ84_DROLE|nr:histone-lysine N-methyltransferase eggless [Scaptodrosophila lebanonensis]